MHRCCRSSSRLQIDTLLILSTPLSLLFVFVMVVVYFHSSVDCCTAKLLLHSPWSHRRRSGLAIFIGKSWSVISIWLLCVHFVVPPYWNNRNRLFPLSCALLCLCVVLPRWRLIVVSNSSLLRLRTYLVIVAAPSILFTQTADMARKGGSNSREEWWSLRWFVLGPWVMHRLSSSRPSVSLFLLVMCVAREM